MRRFVLLLLLLCALPEGLRAQDIPPDDAVEVRAFDEQRLAELRADPAYDYDSDLHREPNWWEQFKEWLAEWLRSLTGPAVAAFIGSNLFIILCAIVVVVALIILSRGGLRRVFYGAPRGQGEVTVAEEDIRGLDLEAMIGDAEAAGDLRRAIRLHYLLVLRKLVDQQVLKWSPEYTDRDYMRQVKDDGLRSRFAHIALVFQWVWYGHAEVDAERYDAIKRPFIEFETMPVP